MEKVTLQDNLRAASVRPGSWDVPGLLQDAANKLDELTQDAEEGPSPPPEKPNVWHLGYNGPRVVTLLWMTAEKGKAVVEFHGVIELVNVADTFPTEEAAYTAAWLREMDAAHVRMKQAAEYKAKADGLRAGTVGETKGRDRCR